MATGTLTPRVLEQIEERARRGAALLDRKQPGWRRRIKRRKLNMGIGGFGRDFGECGCILAQLSPDGTYNTGATEIAGLQHGAAGSATRYGFNSPDSISPWSIGPYFEALTKAWRRVLRDG